MGVGTRARLLSKVNKYAEDTQSRSLLERGYPVQVKISPPRPRAMSRPRWTDKSSSPLSDVKARKEMRARPLVVSAWGLEIGKVESKLKTFTSREGQRKSKDQEEEETWKRKLPEARKYVKFVEPSGVQVLKNPNLLKDVEASAVLDVVVLV